MAAFKVVIADSPTADDHEVEEAAFAASGLQVDRVWLGAHEPERVLEHADADALMMSWLPVTRSLVDQLTHCQVIVRFGIGVDMIDLDAATDRGILVCNTATYCLDEVSNHAIALLLMLNRGLLHDIDAVRSGGWSRGAGAPPRRLAGQRLGLLGLGNIGRLVARKARGLGLEVVAHDPYLRTADGIPLVELDELLATSDFISVHCPLNASTRHLLGRPELARMKPTAFLINTARGPIVEEAALCEALAARRLAGAGLDVFETEPLPGDNPLRKLDNVILTPHSASWSVESGVDCRRSAIEHVVTALKGGVPTDVVNRAVLEREHAG